MIKIVCLFFLFAALFARILSAQTTQHFLYDDENGLPSNEVYSLVEDAKGFIWLGCAAGLYKFDGLRYRLYRCATQKSKSLTNLSISAFDRLYCSNFQSQIFYIEGDSLHELQQPFSEIANIAVDKNGDLYATHNSGISIYKTQTKQWQTVDNFIEASALFTRSICLGKDNIVYFLYGSGIGKMHKSTPTTTEIIPFPEGEKNASAYFLLGYADNKIWAFSRMENVFYMFDGDSLRKNPSQNLHKALENRKITALKELTDGNLWILTYSGAMRYNMRKDEAQVFFEEQAFSDCLIDRAGNYWFSTLQAGIFRVIDLDYLIWNSQNANIVEDKLTNLATDGKTVFFSTIKGQIFGVDAKNSTLKLLYAGEQADIESFDFDTAQNILYFNTKNKGFCLSNEKVSKIPFRIEATKSIAYSAPYYFLGTSQGLFVYDGKETKVSNTWLRQLIWNADKQRLYAASNRGLQIFERRQNLWRCIDTILENSQILCIDDDRQNHTMYMLAFDGKIYALNEKNELKKISQIPENAQAQKLKLYKNSIYIASNKGVYIYNLQDKQLAIFNHLSGLVSDNVQDLLLLNDDLWLATGKGLQKVPLQKKHTPPLAKIYLKTAYHENILLDYGQELTLLPEASAYSSHQQFEYAYRINAHEWVKLPASIEQIKLQNLPVGDLHIELKIIDHSGKDSENTISIRGLVRPPFWKTWWFFLALSALNVFVLLAIFRKRIEILKAAQAKKIAHLMLENELRAAQQAALKAYMNPHFIFNVLNSIKGYIYENDKKNAILYLGRFSELTRKVLEQSNLSYIKLEEEITFLKIYIELEAMLLEDDFSHEIHIDSDLDKNNIKIPSLLVQPFVENAFKHGLKNKMGKNMLKIHFKIENKHLLVEIIDNGIGREAAQKNKSPNAHTSFAMSALSKRIELLNHEAPEMIGLQIVDIFDEMGQAAGTKVILKVKSEK